MKRILPLTRFSGGMASNEKEGVPNSFQYIRSLDTRKNPNLLTVAPGPKKESASVVNDLVLDAVRIPNGDIWAVGDTGHIYKRVANGTWTKEYELGENSGGSIIYRQDINTIYITGQTKVGRILLNQDFTVSGFNADKYGPSRDLSSSGGITAVTLPTSIDEAQKVVFQSNIEPIYSIKVEVNAKGAGDWTLELHDDANNVLASKTIANASVPASGLCEFIFTIPVAIYVKPNARTYHFHLKTSTGTTSKVNAKSVFADVNYEIWGQRLMKTNNGLHPATVFLQYLLVGNGRYLSAYEPLSDNPSNAEWIHHKLFFPPGYEVCGIDVYDEFVAIACEKRSSNSDADFQDGKIFLWDGFSGTYNMIIPVPQGSPLPIFNESNIIHFLSKGAWYGWGGSKPVKLRNLPGADGEFSGSKDKIYLYPNMMTVRNGILLAGFPSVTANQNIEHAVYGYGSLDKNYAPSFSIDYIPSHGVRFNDGANNLRLGMVKNINEDLFISWRNGSDYGVDVVNNTCAPATSAELISLIFDNGAPWKAKKGYRYVGQMKPLPEGSIVTLKYRFERGEWVYSDPAGEGDTEVTMNIAGDRFKELEIGVDIETDGVTMESPAIIALALEFDDLQEEALI